jgi:prophage regulatory protein
MPPSLLPTTPTRFLRLPEVMGLTGLSRSTLYDAIKRGSFPASVPLGGKGVAWVSTEVESWMASRIAARQQ